MTKQIETTMTSLELVEVINNFRGQDSKSLLAHKTLLRTIRHEFKEEIDENIFVPVSYRGGNGQQRTMFDLTQDQAKLLLLSESRTVRKQVVKYINKLEQKVKKLEVPTTFKEALLLAVEQQEVIERKEAQLLLQDSKLKQQAPKVAFADTVLASSNSISVGEFAKVLGFGNLGRNKLFEWFRNNGYLTRNNKPYQSHATKFEVIESSRVDNRTGQYIVNTTTRVMAKYQYYFTEKLENQGYYKHTTTPRLFS